MQPARPGLMSPADSTPNLLSPGMPNNPHHWSTTHLAQFGSNDVGMRGMNGGGHAYGAPPSHMGFYTIGHPHHHFNRYRQPAHLQLARNNLQHSPAHSQSYVHVTSPHSMAQSRDSMQQRLQTMLQHQNASHFTHPSYPVAYPPVSNSYTFSPSNVLRSRPSFERMTSPQRRQSSDAILNDVVSSHNALNLQKYFALTLLFMPIIFVIYIFVGLNLCLHIIQYKETCTLFFTLM